MSCHPFYYKNWSEITKGYGWLDYDPKSKAYHPGFDYNDNNGKGGNGDLNKPIHACKRGIARYAQDSKGGYGLLTVLEHEDGTYSKYAHQNKILVKVGQVVEEGEVIGLAGKSGTSSVHCHHEILTNKLVEYLKKLRPNKWYTFYPDGKTKQWVIDNYLNPLTTHTYPPPAEIKKNMKILLAINESANPNLSALRGILEYVKDYWNIAEIEFTIKTVPYGGYQFPWTGTENTERQITREWTAFNLVPYASQFDAVVFWMTPDEWKSPLTLAYSVREQILGVHVIALACSLDQEDTTFNTPQNNLFAGLLRHELSHMFIQRTKSYCPLNTTKEYRKDYDNTHYFEYVVKDLKQMTKDIDLTNFVGWIPREGKRMFKYNGTSKLKWPFSGAIVPKKVFRSTDNRMFFCCAPNDRDLWSILTENQYNDAIRKGAMSGIMSVPEANWIYYDLGQPLPPSKPKSIKMEIATTKAQELWLRLQGYDFIIPTSHLSN